MKKPKHAKKPTSIRLSDAQRALIESACDSTGLTVSQILETALAETLAEFERTGEIRVKRIRNKNNDTPYAPTTGGDSLSDKIIRGMTAIRQ